MSLENADRAGDAVLPSGEGRNREGLLLKVRLLLLGVLLVLPLAASACRWDRNTLEAEVKGLPDAAQIITGRFERNPRLYYLLRLKRVRDALKTHPNDLPLYDDAGVACDCLGRDTEAMEWMQHKRAHLPPMTAADPAMKEQWYRCYANLGTFRMHSWLRNGADLSRLNEVRRAQAEIATAVRINPQAHFGREKVQAALMAWAAFPKRTETEADGKKIRVDTAFADTLPTDLDPDGKGLLGLIALGGGWESVEVLDGLAEVLQKKNTAKVAYMAHLRADELRAQGKHSMRPAIPYAVKEWHWSIADGEKPEIAKEYAVLRAEADAWQKRRTDYMEVRLKAGRHPDTDPTFWNEWHDSGPPKIHSPFRMQHFLLDQHPYLLLALLAAVPLGLLAGILVGVRFVWRKRRGNIGATQTVGAGNDGKKFPR